MSGRFKGSWSSDDEDRPRYDSETKLVAEYDYYHADGRYSHTMLKGIRADGEKAFLTGRRAQSSLDMVELERRDNPELFFKLHGLEGYLKGIGDEPDLLYRLPELIADMAARPCDPVYILEGEKEVDNARALGLIATTNRNGVGKWRAESNEIFEGRDVVVGPDNDEVGRDHGGHIADSVFPYAKSVRVVELPGSKPKGDLSDWLADGNTMDYFRSVVEKTEPLTAGFLSGGNGEAALGPQGDGRGVRLEDFHAYMPSHNYIFAPSGEAWPATSVNSRIRPVEISNAEGQPVLIPANRWLDQNRPVEQMTWAPGKPQVVCDRLISDGGWIHRVGCNVFNQYRPPALIKGDPKKAGPWIDHVRRVYPNDADHLINWLAHQVQKPDEKTNHALVMGGAQGIGKDTILEPVKAAIGPWNFNEVSPQHMIGRFNGFAKSVILRVSEARDLGDVDRFAFYDHMKTYTAAPPDVLRVDEKFMREYSAFNVCGVIITSNHKTNGIYLPEDDRRHYVAWSDLSKEDISTAYWNELWGWYRQGGIGHVAAYLAQHDLSDFEAKAPPPKTEAFWDIVASNSAPEDDELADAIDKLGNPDAVTLGMVATAAEPTFADWLRDRKNARRVPHKMEECGFKSVRNPNSKRGRWKVKGKDMMIYARKELSIRDAISAAEKRAMEGDDVPF